MAEAYFAVHDENQMSYFPSDEACLAYNERKDQAALASLGPSLGEACPYVPPRQPEGPVGEPGVAPPGWNRPMMTPRRQPDDQPPSPTGEPLSNPPSPGNLRIDFGPNSTPASPENPEDRLPSHLRCLQERPSTSGLRAEQSGKEHASLPLITGFLAELNEPVPGALQIDTSPSNNFTDLSKRVVHEEIVDWPQEMPGTSGMQQTPNKTQPPPPCPKIPWRYQQFAGISFGTEEYQHLAGFFAHPMHTYRSGFDLTPEVESMTTAVYSKMMRGLKYDTSRRLMEAIRRRSYKAKARGKMQRLTQAHQELKNELEEARKSIIALQGKLLQSSDQGRVATATTLLQLSGPRN
ncbi:uncharacterized protein LOC119784552 [Cyprinodon tularosa]|uniref:uncharacterized protein LOC119784552 n=1 Tax=Cyprinodon tularosa TaxID=77115 RepID=UPI0018E29022|nr:uncharacterized protein LOC119784552 [Cyprinodon tularosa]